MTIDLESVTVDQISAAVLAPGLTREVRTAPRSTCWTGLDVKVLSDRALLTGWTQSSIHPDGTSLINSPVDGRVSCETSSLFRAWERARANHAASSTHPLHCTALGVCVWRGDTDTDQYHHSTSDKFFGWTSQVEPPSITTIRAGRSPRANIILSIGQLESNATRSCSYARAHSRNTSFLTHPGLLVLVTSS